MSLPGPHRLALLLAALVVASQAAAAEAWRTYANPRFGATVDYPALFAIEDEPPANGDGQRFFTSDRRARLAVYGFNNASGSTPAQIMASSRKDGVAYSYADGRPDSYVLSGTRGDRIVYERCLRSRVDRTIFNCVDLEYPAAEQPAWGPIVTRISRSLRSGRPW